jgi:hypothetical protein|tara:strand:+ start:758 stop:1210 length:453 start_codon:yes stop_codon:yes gene_type:complete
LANFNAYTFKPKHLNGFVVQEKQENEYKRFQEHGKAMMDYLEEECNTITVQKSGKTIAIFGLIPLPNKGCHGWLFFGDEVGGNDLVIAVKVIRGALDAINEMGYEWIQTPVRTDFEQGERMIRLLKFKETEITEDLMEDGTMYKYWMRVF